MQTINDKLFEKFIDNISGKLKTPNISIYFVALLFAIALDITWLIILFSIFLALTIFISLNKKYKFIEIKHR